MAGWLKRLFGGGEGGAGSRPEPAEVYKGYEITPGPEPKGSQFLTAGWIAKDVGGERREHRFIRADTHPSREQAESFAVVKARQIVDEMGDKMFDDGRG